MYLHRPILVLKEVVFVTFYSSINTESIELTFDNKARPFDFLLDKQVT